MFAIFFVMIVLVCALPVVWVPWWLLADLADRYTAPARSRPRRAEKSSPVVSIRSQAVRVVNGGEPTGDAHSSQTKEESRRWRP